MKKRILSLLLALVMLLGLLPTVALAAEDETTSGTCGENVTWSYDAESKTLTISGNGPMADYTNGTVDPAPWNGLEITNVVVQNGITKIGAFAFYDTTAENISLADSVTTVGQSAFSRTRVTNTNFLTNNLTSIGKTVFQNCEELTDAVWPTGCKAIPSGAFTGCTKLSSITIPEGTTEIGQGAFRNVPKMKSISLPSTITTMGKTAFKNWAADQKIIFPSGYSQETIDGFPDGWNGNATVETAKVAGVTWAFDSTTKTLTVSGTGPMEDYECDEYTFATLAPWAEYADTIKTVVIETGVTTVGANAFSGCTALDTVILPRTVSLKEGAFYNTGITDTSFLTAHVVLDGSDIFGNCANLTSIRLPEGCEDLPLRTFANCEEVTSITLPKTLKTIGENAFAGLSKVPSIWIPRSVTKIEDCAFEGWTAGQTIQFEMTAEEVAANVTLPADWAGDATVTYGVTHTPTATGTCGENVTWAYYADTKTLEVSGTGEMTSAPWGSYDITTLIVNSGVTSIFSYAFCYLNVDTVFLADTVKKIGEGAFAGSKIKDINFLPEDASFDSISHFLDCQNLKTIVFPAGCEAVPDYAFSQCKAAETIIIPEGVKTIGSHAVEQITNVSTICLPSSITSIGEAAFDQWTADQKIIFPSGYSQDTIDSFPTGWNGSAKVLIGGQSVEKPTEGVDGTIEWRYDKATKTLTFSGSGELPGGSGRAWRNWEKEVQKIVVTDNVTSLGLQAFFSSDDTLYPQLEEIVLGSSVKAIKGMAISGLQKLKTLTLPEGLEEIGAVGVSVGNGAISRLPLITELRIPSTVRKIARFSFADMAHVTIPMTEGTARRLITLEKDWDGKTTVSFDPGLNKSWADGAQITLTIDGETFNGTLDLAKYRVTFERPMYTPAEFSLDGASFSSTKGTASVPAQTRVERQTDGSYLANQVLTLTPADGTEGDALPLDVFFTLPEKVYPLQGSGTEADPIRIDCLDALNALAKRVNSGDRMDGMFIKQTADIDMTGVTWTPIGVKPSGASTGYYFNGIYDGDNHRIKNFVYDADTQYFGFFGQLSAGSVVKNLIFDESCSITFRSWGGMLAYNTSGRIENCVNYGRVYARGSQSGSLYVGGLVAFAAEVYNCTNYGDVTGNPQDTAATGPGGNEVGGIVSSAARIVGCTNYGKVTGAGIVGGIAAEATKRGSYDYGLVSGCANYGAVTAEREDAGGIVGHLSGLMEDCYNVGTITAPKTVGGLAGTVYNTEKGMHNCYHAGSVAYGDAEAEPNAGQLIGKLQGMGDSSKAIGDLYYQQIGVLPAVGNYDAGAAAKAMTLSDMKLNSFVRTLNAYKNISLYGVEWKQDDAGKNNGLPVFDRFEMLKNYENELLSLKIAGASAIRGEGDSWSYVLPGNADLTALTVEMEISTGATVTPASGSKVDFSAGPVKFTVTAEDGTPREYIVTVTTVGSGLSALRIGANSIQNPAEFASDPKALLLDPAQFKPDQYAYPVVTRYDAEILAGGFGTSTRLYVWAVRADNGTAKISVKINGSSKNVKVTTDLTATLTTYYSTFYHNKIHYGKNTIELSDLDTAETTYTLTLDLLPSLKSVTFADVEGMTQDQPFQYQTFEYELTVPSSAETLTPTAAAQNSSETVTFLPALSEDGTLNIAGLDSFQIKVAAANDESVSTTYTYAIRRVQSYTAEIETNVSTANIRVTDPDGKQLEPANGVYDLVSGKTYSYVVAAKGYKSQTGTIAGPSDLTDGKLTLTLEAVAPNTLKKFDALWPSFRGNDNNMAITASATRTSSNETGLLWSTAAGKGMDTGAVGSPIIVDGYLYAYSGTNIVKIDKSTGEIVKKGDMVATSDFAIIPPTYAEGMIFVGLSKGRVQAFNAETLESLWVYTDPRGGQSNSPITYSDGCVYTGFWNGESGRTNFVCLTIDDEDPAATTEAKQALWTYTQLGGFYWAGAYAHGDYVLVGTDDGQSGYTSATANLLVFDKTSGEVVDSKTGYVGDIRSNVAYDATTDRVYFTSKGGWFYSEQIDWSTGKIKTAASKSIDLGGMSTSTPVVYNGCAYVGVSGSGQFTVGSGHHIAVLDLDNWAVAYTANTKGYPQTSGLLSTAYEAETGYVYVYFMDNYTPGALRVIRDKAGQTALLDGVTEDQVDANGKVTTVENCAPIVFEPKGELAQYCICSPIADENGVIYFKNDTGNMMAVGHTTGFQGYTVTFDANGGTIAGSSEYVANKLSNKLEKMPTARRDGYTLLGYFTEAEGGDRVTLDTVYSKDTTVYAHWEKAADPERKDSVTVYFSISNDGEYLQSSITGQTLAQLPVTLNYFDLKEYGLQDFYRTGADGKAIVHPTLLHLFIRMLEKQYLGNAPLEPGKSVNTKLQYGKNESDELYKALKITGSATSMYMTNFWGHDENLLYYVNHQYPLMYEGWGSTADWILLEDGDAIEVAMFTDWDFIHNEEAGFPYFRQGNAILDDLTLAAGEQQTLTVARATADASGERGEKLNPNTKIYYTTNLNRVSGDVTTWTALGTTDASGNITVSFDAPGTYYIAVPGSSVRAPGICKVTIVADAAVAAAASKINAIGPVDETSGDKIKAAREAFDALTPEQQAQIPEATRNKLTEAEKAYQAILNQKAAASVVDRIKAIGPVTKESGAAIEAARDAYNNLTDAAKKLVSNYEKLTEAEAKYADLMKPDIPATPSNPAKPSQNPNAGETLLFTDVNANSWYYSGVKFAYEKGLMNGTGNGTFSPNADTTRGMIVTMLARLEGVSTSGTPWYAASQKWAMDAGISDGTNMTGAITREQLAAILFRYAKQKGYDVSKSVAMTAYSDAASVSAYATEAMQWAVASGLIQGSDSKLSPKATASRAQVATILMRFMELYAK